MSDCTEHEHYWCDHNKKTFSVDLTQEELDTLVTLFQCVGGHPSESRRKFVESAEGKMMDAGGRILSWAEECYDITKSTTGGLTFRDNLDEVLDFDYDAVLDFEPLKDALDRYHNRS